MPVTEHAIEPGRCAFCGCTDAAGCDAFGFAKHAATAIGRTRDEQGLIIRWRPEMRGCSWVNDEHTCCSVCDAVLRRLAELPELGYQRAIALTDETREALRAIRGNG